MWKALVCYTLLLGYSHAGPAVWSEDISVHNNPAVTGIHYSQHESSVYAARKAAAERLQQQSAALVAGSSLAVPCDTICHSSFSADASDAETIGQGTVGFAPTASGTSQKYLSASSSRLESSVQNVHAAAPLVYPVAATTGARSSFSSSSSSRLHSASNLNAAPVYGGSVDLGRTHSNVVASDSRLREGTTYVQPVVYTVAAPQTHSTSSQSSYNERLSQERAVVGRPTVVYTAVPVAGSTHSSSNYNTRASFVQSASDQQQQQIVQPVVQPVAYPTATSDYSRRYQVAHQDQQYRQYPAKPSSTYVVYSKPQYYSAGRTRTEDASSTSYDSSGRVVNLNLIQPASHTAERVDEQRTQQRVESVQSVQRPADLYPATRGSYDESTLDQDEVDNTARTPVASSSSVSSAHRREHAGSVRTGTSYVPSAGSSTNQYAHSSEGQRRVTYHAKTPEYVPVSGGTVSSSSRYESASEQQQQQQRHGSVGGTYVVPVVVQPGASHTGTSTASRYAASSSAQEHRTNTHAAGGNTGAYYGGHSSSSNTGSRYKAGHYPIANDEMGRRFGATGRAGGYGADTDLQDIMSESETLARLQAQNVHNGAAVTGSGTIEADTRFGGGADADGLGTMPGGYQRTKSWSSSSKWASEQRYGEDGKPKTYSMLSTAESEKHHINGKTTGYKAATTTLEDDGKVSTYSLHTT